MGNHRLAINDFNESIDIDPNLAIAYYRRGVSKFHSKNFHDAISDFRESAKKEAEQEEEISDDFEKNSGIPDGLG